MKQELKDQLCEYLGELMYDYENSNDFFNKRLILQKKNAINILLHIETHGESWETMKAVNDMKEHKKNKL